MTPPSIRLHIERVVLEGVDVDPRDGPRARAAIELELTRLLTRGGLRSELSAAGAVPLVKGGDMAAESGTSTDATGSAIARAAYAGIGK